MTDPRSVPNDGARDRGSHTLVLGALLALWALSPAPPASALGNFTRHLTITVGAGVVGGPHASFPVLVDVANADLRTTPNGSVQSASGYDIVFRGEDTAICGGPASCMPVRVNDCETAAAGI
jgi:hypothetical protein